MLRLRTGTKSRRGQYTEFVASLFFGAFELDLQREELRRGGVLLKLAPQQFRTLRYLAENAGRVCTREEIQRSIWDAETFVDFDRRSMLILKRSTFVTAMSGHRQASRQASI